MLGLGERCVTEKSNICYSAVKGKQCKLGRGLNCWGQAEITITRDRKVKVVKNDELSVILHGGL